MPQLLGKEIGSTGFGLMGAQETIFTTQDRIVLIIVLQA
jgi:hypothetical protein